MKVWDTMIFGGEGSLDLLKVRLEELDNSLVYRHVISEARVDHQGNPKPLFVAEHIGCCLAPWKDKITCVIPDIPEGVPPWAVENMQREAIRAGMQEARPDDYVMLCDVDEIPSRSAMARRPKDLITFVQQWSLFAVDWVHPHPSATSVAGPWGAMKSLAALRLNDNRVRMPKVPDGGRHFTWLGGPDGIRRKLAQFCHTEISDFVTQANDAGELYEQGLGWDLVSPANGRVQLIPAEMDETWPAAMRERRCPPEWFRPR